MHAWHATPAAHSFYENKPKNTLQLHFTMKIFLKYIIDPTDTLGRPHRCSGEYVHAQLAGLTVSASKRKLPGRPHEHRVLSVEMGVKAAIMHQIVHEEELVAAAMALANELHKVPVPQPANDAHLRDELLPSLSRGPGHPLDGHFTVHVAQEPSVN